MQYKCRPFFVFMGKTEEFCCPEIQTHILHDKMIMKKEKTYSRAPLPFVGQKRMFVSEFKKILKHFDDKTIFVDLFGGSGLLSHITKRERPDAVVIYNDHDNYRERLENIDRTNTLLRDLRKIVGIYPAIRRLPEKCARLSLNASGWRRQPVSWTILPSLLPYCFRKIRTKHGGT